MYLFTADEHYGHENIIRYCSRPFSNIEEMDSIIIQRHNETVGKNDIVIHAGDFTLKKGDEAQYYIEQLKGNHIFLRGSHDYWLTENVPAIWEKTIEGHRIVVLHYAMRVWACSHYNSWQLYGHSHGMLEPIGKQWDIGVDNNDFYPVSFGQIKEIMKERPDNLDFIKTN